MKIYPLERICQQCGAIFLLRRKYHRVGKFCNSICYGKYKMKARERGICKHCHKIFTYLPKGQSKGKFCGRECLKQWKRQNGDLVYGNRDHLKAEDHPILRDIAWAAGIYEGEGSAIGRDNTTYVQVAQKDPWLLHKMKGFFGGSLYYRKKPSILNGHEYPPIPSWNISGGRARGFLMTIYPFLSPRRQKKIKEIMADR